MMPPHIDYNIIASRYRVVDSDKSAVNLAALIEKVTSVTRVIIPPVILGIKRFIVINTEKS
jgi:hypothetical protein